MEAQKWTGTQTDKQTHGGQILWKFGPKKLWHKDKFCNNDLCNNIKKIMREKILWWQIIVLTIIWWWKKNIYDGNSFWKKLFFMNKFAWWQNRLKKKL